MRCCPACSMGSSNGCRRCTCNACPTRRTGSCTSSPSSFARITARSSRRCVASPVQPASTEQRGSGVARDAADAAAGVDAPASADSGAGEPCLGQALERGGRKAQWRASFASSNSNGPGCGARHKMSPRRHCPRKNSVSHDPPRHATHGVPPARARRRAATQRRGLALEPAGIERLRDRRARAPGLAARTLAPRVAMSAPAAATARAKRWRSSTTESIGRGLKRPRIVARALSDQLFDQPLGEVDVALDVTHCPRLHQERQVVHEAPQRVHGVVDQRRFGERLPQHRGVQARQQRQALPRQATVGQDRVVEVGQPLDGALFALGSTRPAAAESPRADAASTWALPTAPVPGAAAVLPPSPARPVLARGPLRRDRSRGARASRRSIPWSHLR